MSSSVQHRKRKQNRKFAAVHEEAFQLSNNVISIRDDVHTIKQYVETKKEEQRDKYKLNNRKLQSLEIENTRLKVRNNAISDDFKRKSDNVSTKEREIDTLQKTAEYYKNENQKYREETIKMKETIKNKESREHNMNDCFKKLESEKQSLQDENAGLKVEIFSISADFKQKNEEASGKEREINKLRESIQDHKTEIQNNREEHIKMKAVINSYKSQEQRMNNRLKQCEDENRKLQDFKVRNMETNTRNIENEKKVETLHENVSNLRVEKNTLEHMYITRSEELDKLRICHGELQHDFKNVQSKIQSYENICDNFIKATDMNKNTIKEQKLKIEELTPVQHELATIKDKLKSVLPSCLHIFKMNDDNPKRQHELQDFLEYLSSDLQENSGLARYHEIGDMIAVYKLCPFVVIKDTHSANHSGDFIVELQKKYTSSNVPILIDTKSTTQKEREIPIRRDNITKLGDDINSICNTGIGVRRGILILAQNHNVPHNCTQPVPSIEFWVDGSDTRISYVKRDSAHAIICAIVHNMITSAYENGHSDGTKENEKRQKILTDEVLTMNVQKCEMVKDLQQFSKVQNKKHTNDHKASTSNLKQVGIDLPDTNSKRSNIDTRVRKRKR